MKNTEEEIVRSIYESLSALPASWDEAVFYAEYGEASFQMEFYLRKEQENYVKCFDIPEVSEEQLDMMFWNLNKVIKPLREELPTEQKWSNCTVQLHNDGRFKIDFDYMDLSDCAYEYHQAWKQRYLL